MNQESVSLRDVDVLAEISEDQQVMSALSSKETSAVMQTLSTIIYAYFELQSTDNEDAYDKVIDRLGEKTPWIYEQVHYGAHIDSHQPLLNVVISYCRGQGRTKALRPPRVYGR